MEVKKKVERKKKVGSEKEIRSVKKKVAKVEKKVLEVKITVGRSMKLLTVTGDSSCLILLLRQRLRRQVVYYKRK